ncbi:diacylglycerol/lipid kinase family protein [Actinomycetospora termitidis]|uniref:Diacylglycerol kinase family protein n=1 Tax=Actinomycetospora termitidis TaxID=3053470 RepID=A0ABT7M3A8_9PSEU|nr:diacylglycerol kinase family protein [Actinomycetospora sp. Odt1-22]MDL5155153.1 diacylglycerol kinase family protein [Actinomycetospora sp. Odt1-22]
MSAAPGPSPDAPAFRSVLLVYNPNSTGGGEGKAHTLARELRERAPELDVELVPTEYAGHARRIAESAARTYKPLVVSVSGDGGYNEVVDGAMAGGDGHRTGTVVAVTSAGNANDHRRVTRRRPLAEAIADGKVDHLDVLRLTIGRNTPRYAHSYIGLGITPVVALALERGGKGSLRELVTTFREFLHFSPFEIELEAFEGESRDGVGVGEYLGPHRYDSLIVANLSEMAKYARLSEGDPADGRFEIVSIPHRGRVRLLFTGLRAAWKGLGWQPSARHLRFRTFGELPLQLDGEVIMLPGDTSVAVELVPGALATVR